MGLFTTVDVIGQGLPLFTPKGTKMIMKLQRWIEDLEDNEWGYVRTRTPLMAKADLYKISGHWDHYMDGMFILNKDSDDKETMALRPMTCPFQYYVYMNEQHSYRDLPYRMAETSTLFRNEDSGEMHGLTRVRQFTITEAHIILRPDQAEEELTRCTELCHYVMKTLGIDGDVTYRLSKWDPNNKEKYLGDEEYWNSTQQYLRNVMKENHIPFTEADGEAAFYGPKIDIQAKNVYGKEDTMVTIQLDCASAEKFGMYYIDEKGEKVLPWIIHRTSMGCYERTLAWLIEHYAGKFPTWLCPEQVRVLPISEKYMDYANKVAAELKKKHVDVTVDSRDEKVGDLIVEDYKIREYLKKTLYSAGIPNIEIERDSAKVRIYIHCSRPGVVIGKGGAEIERIRLSVEKMIGKPVALSIVEVRTPDTNAQLVAENIAAQLEKRIGFRRAMKNAMGRAMRMGARGIKIMCSGRLGGAEIARTECYHEGTIPLQTIRADIEYGFAEAATTYGRVGVKVWIYKGEILSQSLRTTPRTMDLNKRDDRRRDRRDGDRRGRGGYNRDRRDGNRQGGRPGYQGGNRPQGGYNRGPRPAAPAAPKEGGNN